MTIINIFIIVVLLMFAAFFVVCEFSIVKVSQVRLDYLEAQGNKKAKWLQQITNNLDGYLSATQLGVTLTSLGLGWIGESTVEHLLHPLFVEMGLSSALTTTISATIAFLFVTYMHVVLGELVPKTFAIQKTESIGLIIARPLIIFNYIAYPLIWLLNSTANLISRIFGVSPANEQEEGHSEEELRMMVSDSYQRGEINYAEYDYVHRVFKFDERLSKEIMIPRTEMIDLSKNKPFQESLKMMQKYKRTRYPVSDGDKDHIIGMVNVKDLIGENAADENQNPLEEFTRPIIRVIEMTPIKELLEKMKKERMHMAVLLDEYGGTAGMVTIEDIIEEIVGDIRDEFDNNERQMIRHLGKHKTRFDGKVLISEVNDMLGLNIGNRDLDTLGGWFLARKPGLQKGAVTEQGNYQFTVEEMDGDQVKTVQVVNKNKLKKKETKQDVTDQS